MINKIASEPSLATSPKCVASTSDRLLTPTFLPRLSSAPCSTSRAYNAAGTCVCFVRTPHKPCWDLRRSSQDTWELQRTGRSAADRLTDTEIYRIHTFLTGTQLSGGFLDTLTPKNVRQYFFLFCFLPNTWYISMNRTLALIFSIRFIYVKLR